MICSNGIAEIEGKKLLQLVCSNDIAEIGGKKKIVAIGLWQWHCRNRRKQKKKFFFLIFSNGIAEIGNWRRERERERPL